MAPTTRRSTRSSGSSSSPSKSSPKKGGGRSSPKKSPGPKGRPRTNKAQPRIDESLNTFKSAASTTAHGEEETKRILSQDGVDGEVHMQMQLKSGGVKRGRPYEIREASSSPQPSSSSSILNESVEFYSPVSSSSSTRATDSQEEGKSWSQESYYSSPDASPSKLGDLLRSPAVSTTSSVSSSEEVKDESAILKHFDMNHLCGPCRGISRSDRYYRALRYKIQPPPPIQVLEILNAHKHEKNYEMNWETCIWDQHDMRPRVSGRPNFK